MFIHCLDEISNYTVYNYSVSFKIMDIKLKIGYILNIFFKITVLNQC